MVANNNLGKNHKTPAKILNFRMFQLQLHPKKELSPEKKCFGSGNPKNAPKIANSAIYSALV